jgi:MFS family permease
VPKSQIGAYSGFIEALFSIAQFFSNYHWGKWSDTVCWPFARASCGSFVPLQIGRKPVVLFGLFSLAVFMTLYGAATTFWWAVIFRAMCGLLSGNGSVLRAVLAEITSKQDASWAYAVYSSSFDIAIIFAPALGGFLAEPAVQYPHSIFAKFALFRKLPFLLPCVVVSTFAILSFLITLFFFKETLATKVDQPGEASETDPLLSNISIVTATPEDLPGAPSLWELLRMPEIRPVRRGRPPQGKLMPKADPHLSLYQLLRLAVL